MPVKSLKTVARLEGNCAVQDADVLLEWLTANPKGKVNLKSATQIHGAVLQVLMALQPSVSCAPDDEALGAWLMPILQDPAMAGAGAAAD